MFAERLVCTAVLYPSGSSTMKSRAFPMRSDSATLSSVASRFANLMLSITDIENRTDPCERIEILEGRSLGGRALMSTPSRRIFPSWICRTNSGIAAAPASRAGTA
jgi:hypothetical protein